VTPTAGTTPGLTRGALIDEVTALLGGTPHEARFIVDEAVGDEGTGAGRRDEVSAASAGAARAMAARRAAGEPLQYVFGHWAFRSLDLAVTPDVLIPRPETEQVVDVALAELRALGVTNPLAVDAGTGSGAIALALCTEVPGITVWATDSSTAALRVAQGNQARIERCGRPFGALHFVEGNWLDPLPTALRGAVDLVVSNPPYVAESEWPDLPAEVRAEPLGALVAPAGRSGTPGLAFVETVLEQAFTSLGRPGVAVIELAPHQAAAACAYATAVGYDHACVERDLTGRPRALVARVH
jgi:release factor glutamine methyltransferase